MVVVCMAGLPVERVWRYWDDYRWKYWKEGVFAPVFNHHFRMLAEQFDLLVHILKNYGGLMDLADSFSRPGVKADEAVAMTLEIMGSSKGYAIAGGNW